LLEVTDDVHPEVCFASGHGELPLGVRDDGQDYSALQHALERDGVRASSLPDLAAGIPARCALVAIVGPRSAVPAAEAVALDAYLARGGRVLVALDPDLPPGASEVAPSGLETVLLGWGVRLGPGVVVDPSQEVQGLPFTWKTLLGYGQHPISSSFLLRRDTFWFAPRWVAPVDVPGVHATALVSSSGDGWVETSVGELRGRGAARDDKDAPGPAPVAVAAEKAENGARLVVFGSARTFTSEVIDRHLGASDLLFASAVAWLSGRSALVGVGAKNPEQFRLSLSKSETRRMFGLCVIGLPALAGLLGLAFLWRRRRAP
jgi:ABC-type uncharacterized transport system involved in gliding motility auxiliary subunit